MAAGLQRTRQLGLQLRGGLTIADEAIVQGARRRLRLHLRQQRGQGSLRIADDAHIHRAVEANGGWVGVNVNQGRARGRSPQRRFSPRVQFTQARADDEHDVALAAGRGQGILVEDVDVLRVIFGHNAARGQGGGHDRAQVFAQGDERRGRCGPGDAAAGVQQRAPGAGQ